MMKKVPLLFIIALCFITSCATENNEQPSPPPFQQMTKGEPTSQTVRLIAEQNEFVDSANAVVIGKNISTGLKVSNFNRLRLKQIRQDVHQRLTIQFPDYDIHVSTDRKIWMELDKLHKDIELKKLPKKEAYNRVQKINEDMKG